jgi:RNA-directed DNA polymerase
MDSFAIAAEVVRALRDRPCTVDLAAAVLVDTLGADPEELARLARGLWLAHRSMVLGQHPPLDAAEARRRFARSIRRSSMAGTAAELVARVAADPERLLGMYRHFGPPRERTGGWPALAKWLGAQPRFARLCAARPPLGELPRPRMLPAPGAPATWNVPALTTPPALAAWLGVPLDRLLAWTRRFHPDPERRDARLHHYHCRWRARRRGVPRLLEAPKAALKAAQRRVLDGILAAIPPHAAAHGFVPGRSVATFTAPHTGKACVLRLDVQDFFASIRGVRVRRVFASVGYPSDVAALLAALCTTTTPRAALAGLAEHGAAGAALAERLRRAHLPQGAPTSPALANLCAHALDRRLTGLARRFGADYTRYADDLLFSGDAAFARGSARCAAHASAILLREQLTTAHRKTRVMRAAAAQHAGGLVLNVHAAVPRRERELLEAILVNCARHGPSTQNRAGVADFRAHLRGRIAHVAHAQPPHAARLLAHFARIDWSR